MKPKGSLSCSQQPAIVLHPQPDESSPQPPTLFKIHFNIIFTVTCLQSGRFSLSFPTICPYPLSLVPMRTTCPTHLTILLSQLHLAKIINYEALCWVYFSTILLLPPSVRLLHCCSFNCSAITPFSVLFPLLPHTAEGGNGIVFSLFEA